MKRTLPVLILLIAFTSMQAQLLPVITNGDRVARMQELHSPLPEYSSEQNAPVDNRNFEQQIGITRFDLQTIGSPGRRIADFGDGKISATWLFGLDQNGGWPDRGAAYNHFDGSEWGAEPDFSLETTRSGYPCFDITPNGLEVVFSHKNTSATQWYLQVNTKMPGDANWTETEIPSTVPGGPVWGKVATGGPDGNTIHAVAVSVDPMFGGSVYEGMNQHPLYYRSTDAGASWDKVDVIIPGLDTTSFSNFAGESYNIAARGETVAIGVFDSWGDVAIFKSEDNGETWTKTIVSDFPLDKYDGSGYGPGDVPTHPDAPDSVSIFTADYSGSVLIDHDGKVHVFFGTMFVFAEGANQFLWLDSQGIGYWNEDHATDEIDIIAALEDFNGDMLINIAGPIADIRYNNTGLTSFPSSGIDADGDIYLVYTALHESFISVDDYNYRHAFVIKSEDGGANWTDPFDLINEDVTEFYDFVEGAYPAISTNVGDKLELIYQQDYEPGLTNTTGGEIAPDQYIMHVSFDKDSFDPISNISLVNGLEGDISLTPNPTTDGVYLNFELASPADVKISVFTMLGNQVCFAEKENMQPGNHREWIPMHDNSAGLYFVKLELGGGQVTKKLILN